MCFPLKIIACAVFAVVGCVLSTCLLVFNEFRYVMFQTTVWHVSQETQEAGCISSPVFNDKLVHVSCPVTHLPNLAKDDDLQFLSPLLSDPMVNGSDLLWETEMYQWVSHTHRRRMATTYWTKEWSDLGTIENHDENPRPPDNAWSGQALANPKSIWIGDPKHPKKGYHVSAYLRKQMLKHDNTSLFVNRTPQEEFVPGSASLNSAYFHTCSHNVISTEPCDGPYRLGGIRMAFEHVKPTFVSVVAKQTFEVPGMVAAAGNRRLRKTFIHGFGESAPEEDEVVPPHEADFPPAKLTDYKVGNLFYPAYDAEFLFDGRLSLHEMVSKLNSENSEVLWLMRLGGWLAMGFSLFLLFNIDNVPVCLGPFGLYVITFGDIFALFGDRCEFVAYLVNYFVCCVFALPPVVLIIAIAWVLARPLIGCGLLLLGAALLLAVRYFGREVILKNEVIQNNRKNTNAKYDNLVVE